MLLFVDFVEKKSLDMKKNIFEGFFSYNYDEEIKELTEKIEKCEKLNTPHQNIEYIRLVGDYVKTLIKMIAYDSTWDEETNDYTSLFKYAYSKLGLMKAHSIHEQEMILKVIKRMNSVCDKFDCEKVKNANGEII